MARRRKAKKSYSKSGALGRIGKVILGAVVPTAYGAFRSDISSAMPKVQALGNYSDETILGGAALLAQAATGNKWVNIVTKPISDIELGIVGAKVRGSSGSSSSPSGNVLY